MWLVIEQDVSELTCESSAARRGPREIREQGVVIVVVVPLNDSIWNIVRNLNALYGKNKITPLCNEDQITRSTGIKEAALFNLSVISSLKCNADSAISNYF